MKTVTNHYKPARRPKHTRLGACDLHTPLRSGVKAGRGEVGRKRCQGDDSTQGIWNRFPWQPGHTVPCVFHDNSSSTPMAALPSWFYFCLMPKESSRLVSIKCVKMEIHSRVFLLWDGEGSRIFSIPTTSSKRAHYSRTAAPSTTKLYSSKKVYRNI